MIVQPTMHISNKVFFKYLALPVPVGEKGEGMAPFWPRPHGDAIIVVAALLLRTVRIALSSLDFAGRREPCFRAGGKAAGMRLLYLLTSLGIGGAERQATALAQHMAGRGHTVALLVLRAPQDEQWPSDLPAVYLHMQKRPLPLLAGMLAGGCFVRRYRPDLIHSHTFPANLAGRVLAPLASSAKLLATIHNVFEGGWQRSLAYRLSDGLCVATTAVSRAVAERSIQAGMVPAHKCLVLPNGIDSGEFQPSAERRLRTRACLGAAAAFVWLAAGRIVPAKDFPTLLRAFALLRAAQPQALLWIAGEAGNSTFDRMGKKLLDPALMTGVRWLGLRRDLPALLDGADGFVLSSAWEGMPLVVGEAMAMEKPVAATDAGGVRELLGESGVIVPAGNPARLAEAMLGLMQLSDEQRRAVGRAARQRILERFSIEAIADRWEELYLRLLGLNA